MSVKEGTSYLCGLSEILRAYFKMIKAKESTQVRSDWLVLL